MRSKGDENRERGIGVGAFGLWILIAASVARAQTPDLQQILQRLDRLEAQNQELMNEIRALRQQLATAPGSAAPGTLNNTAPPEALTKPETSEKAQVEQSQISQLDQEKISSDHRLPISLTGMALFNTFWTGKGAGGADNPTLAAAPSTLLAASGGATFRQSVIGVKFDGPTILGGAKVTGSVYADFFGGAGTTLNQLLRLRVASVDAAWKNTTITLALDKPIIAPREPDSLAQVGVSPLTSAGNLWLWEPQVRVEQRFALGSQSGLRAQAGIYQTSEGGTGVTTGPYASTLAKDRPGYQGRFEFWSQIGESRRIEIAPGFHASDTRVAGDSVPSRIFTVDWLIRPVSRVDFTGTFFHGENVGVVGGLRQGVNILGYEPRPVHASGGWAQVKLRVTPRLSFNVYGGEEDDRNSDLAVGGIGRNLSYAGNVMYRFGSNILGSFEASQTRTNFIGSGTRIFPHYDLGLAYLF
ncbi:MAG TPA: hypothetical protein VH639_02590 [Bryobacteraceae bacterium]